MSNETRKAVNELANSVLPASITPQSLGNVLTQIVAEIEHKADETDPNVLTSIAYDDLVYDNPFFAMIPTGNAIVNLFINGYSLIGCTLSWHRTTYDITFSITGALTIGADGELDIILGIENPVPKETYLLSRNNVLCTKNTNNEYHTPWMYRVDTNLLSTAVEYVDQKLGSIPKRKTGDVVVRTDKADDGTFKIVSWEEYYANPSAYPDAIGLVADPVKRTFVFRQPIGAVFATADAVTNLLSGYSSFDNGQELLNRLGSFSSQSDFPVFYKLWHNTSSYDGIFYQKNKTAYVPSLNEWMNIYDSLATAFYDDANVCASYLDRFRALCEGATPSAYYYYQFSVFNGNGYDTLKSPFYATLSTIGVANDKTLRPFHANGKVGNWTLDFANCIVFGLYTEEDENNG